MTTVQPERLLTVKEVAEMLQVSETWVYQRLRSNEIAHVRVGGVKRMRREAVEAYLLSATVPVKEDTDG